jgi:hypothetical protein
MTTAETVPCTKPAMMKPVPKRTAAAIASMKLPHAVEVSTAVPVNGAAVPLNSLDESTHTPGAGLLSVAVTVTGWAVVTASATLNSGNAALPSEDWVTLPLAASARVTLTADATLAASARSVLSYTTVRVITEPEVYTGWSKVKLVNDRDTGLL